MSYGMKKKEQANDAKSISGSVHKDWAKGMGQFKSTKARESIMER
jgi:hypothetical protein